MEMDSAANCWPLVAPSALFRSLLGTLLGTLFGYRVFVGGPGDPFWVLGTPGTLWGSLLGTHWGNFVGTLLGTLGGTFWGTGYPFGSPGTLGAHLGSLLGTLLSACTRPEGHGRLMRGAWRACTRSCVHTNARRNPSNAAKATVENGSVQMLCSQSMKKCCCEVRLGS